MKMEFSEWVENTVGKGEIACYEQVLLFSQCFQKIYTAAPKKPGLVWERVKGHYWENISLFIVTNLIFQT